MENRSHALIAGLFTLFLGVALVLSVWWIGGKHEMTRDYIVVTRQNVTGLSLQGQVRYRGIRVGKVQAIELDPADVRNILIRISVNDSVPVTRGTVAKMGYQGVTGIAHILLEESGDDPEPLPGDAGDASRIAMQPSLIEELSDAGGATLRAAGAFLSNANKLLDSENRQNFARILVNLEATTANANDAIAQFRQLLTEATARRSTTSVATTQKSSVMGISRNTSNSYTCGLSSGAVRSNSMSPSTVSSPVRLPMLRWAVWPPIGRVPLA